MQAGCGQEGSRGGAAPGVTNGIAACRGNSSNNNEKYATHEAASVKLRDCFMAGAAGKVEDSAALGKN